ncbi:DUF4214 domain-containing protein [Rhabdochromatium marinum]|uniref:DUF4214 domain-containing protein n=1 Tax=Rhabdochromatium marinum TaxID=48729 RepID=UPI00190611AF|nr:DUF4214 domain-containing protein [Rhabdochromatium marinum]MBK1649859.1 hypothetical protein [Rhabdochromatium marinum]
MTYQDIVQQFFISYYDRPADPGGYSFWLDALSNPAGEFYIPQTVVTTANTVDDILNDGTYGTEITGVITRFGTSNEFTAKYGTDPTADDFVNDLYMNVLNRGYVPTGDGTFWLEYYDQQIADGATPAEARANLAILFVGGIAGGSPSDQAMIGNKVTLANQATTDAQSLIDAGLTDESNQLVNYVRDDLFNQNLADPDTFAAAETSLANEYDDLLDSTGAMIDLDGMTEVSGTAGVEDIFALTFDSASGSMVATGTQVTITNFTVGEDTLRFIDGNAATATPAQFFAADTGIMPVSDGFDNQTLILFRPDGDSFDPAPSSITLVGVSNLDSAGANQIDVATLTAVDGAAIYELV